MTIRMDGTPGEGGGSATAWLREAIEAARRGDRFLALGYLEQVLQEDPDHEAALLWKAGLTLDRQEAMWCLRRVLAKNPHNARARAGLAWLQQQEQAEQRPQAPAWTAEPEQEQAPEVQWEAEAEPEEAAPWPEEAPAEPHVLIPEPSEAEVGAPEPEEPGIVIPEPGERDIVIPEPGEPGIVISEPEEAAPEPVEEVPALLTGPRLGAGEEEVDWLQARLGRERGPGAPEEGLELEEEGAVGAEASPVFPSIVDQLRSGMLAEETSPEAVPGRPARAMGGVQWLILILLFTALCGVVGMVWFLVSRPGQTVVPPVASVVETLARAPAEEGEVVQAPPLTDASSGDLSIVQVRYLPATEGMPIRMLGEVTSNAAYLLTDLQVEVALYNAAGEEVLQQPGLVARRVMAPGARSPFEVILREPPAEWERYSVRVGARPIGPEVLEYYPVVVVPAHEAQELGGGRYRIQGEVENQAAFPAEQVEVVCTLYAGEEEAIVAVAFADVAPPTLAPGERGTFAVETQVSEGIPVSGYRLFAQGLRAEGQ